MPNRKKYYFGNYPNSSGYDPNIPIGYNRWDDDNYSDETENNYADEPENNTEAEENSEKGHVIKRSVKPTHPEGWVGGKRLRPSLFWLLNNFLVLEIIVYLPCETYAENKAVAN